MPPSFSALLRQHRIAAGLTQEELAERAGLSVRGISDLERGQRTRPHRITIDMLASALNLSATDHYQFVVAGRGRSVDEHERAGLPVYRTAFIGRVVELAEVGDLLERAQVVSLVGAAGCGKTRLAVEAAGRYRALLQSVWFADLAQITDGRLTMDVIATAVGVERVPASVGLSLTWLRRIPEGLLLLDNCEHVVEDAAAAVAELTRASPRIRVLATSREPLWVEGEHLYRLDPLDVPPAHGFGLESLRDLDSVRLFLDRAALVERTFSLDAANARAVAAICRRLDGIPLALELAAACVSSVGVTNIHNRLRDRFQLLVSPHRTTAPRHKTLAAAIEWSEALLTVRERTAFRRLGTFVGSFDLAAAEAVTAGTDLPVADVLPLLQSLVNRSLVSLAREGTGERYRMLESVRDLARDRMAASDELRQCADAHAKCFSDRARSLYWALERPMDPDERRAVMADEGNYRAALNHLYESGSDRLVEMIASLHFFLLFTPSHNESRKWLEIGLQGKPTDPRACWSIRYSLGLLLGREDREDAVREHMKHALVAARDAHYVHGQVLSLVGLAEIANRSGDLDSAMESAVAATDLAARHGNDDQQCIAECQLAWVLTYAGTFARAHEHARASLVLARRLRNPMRVQNALEASAVALLRSGDARAALRMQSEALQIASWTEFRTLEALVTMAAILVANGWDATAMRLAGAIDGNAVDRGFRFVSTWFIVQDLMARAERRLGDSATMIRDSGRAMDIREAVVFALTSRAAAIEDCWCT
jgi:predicted ATPase/DNA-binding XRE family transcriptional regulator